MQYIQCIYSVLIRYNTDHSACQWEKLLKYEKKDIPQASQTSDLEISHGKTQILLAAVHRTTANLEHCIYIVYTA
jgi:hypothetical protein